MKHSLQVVVDALIKQGRKGITFDSFPRGKELRKRIMEAKEIGYKIEGVWETLPGGCRRKRYILLGMPK